MKKIFLSLLISPFIAGAQQITVDMFTTPQTKSGDGVYIGKIVIEDSEFGGIMIKPSLENLSPGIHGFHIHTEPTCEPTDNHGHVVAAGAAGGHLDPAQTNTHLGPFGKGHLGDLPVLVVEQDQRSTLPMLAPRLKTSDLLNHSVMIHMGGDNYSDIPAPNGGGAERIACGVIK